jgi:hypothetical protein
MSLRIGKREERNMNRLNELYLQYVGIDPDLAGHIVLGIAIFAVFILVF